MVRKDLLIVLTKTFTVLFQIFIVFDANEAYGSNTRHRTYFSNLTNRLKQVGRLIKKRNRNDLDDGMFVRKTFYNNLAKKRRRNGSNLRWNITWPENGSGVNTKDLIDNSTNSQTHQDPLYHEFMIPFRVRRFFNISTKEKRKIRRKRKRKYKGGRRNLIKSYRKNFNPFIETMFIMQQSTPGKIFEEYMYSKGGQVANNKNTKLKSQIYQRSNLPVRDMIMPAYQTQDNGMMGSYPGGVQLINIVPSGYQQQGNAVGPLETAISELTHALDRQQVSGEMQQLTNTMAQTMLNTLILSNEFHH